MRSCPDTDIDPSLGGTTVSFVVFSLPLRSIVQCPKSFIELFFVKKYLLVGASRCYGRVNGSVSESVSQ